MRIDAGFCFCGDTEQPIPHQNQPNFVPCYCYNLLGSGDQTEATKLKKKKK